MLGPVQAVGDTLVVGAAAENDDDFIISDDSKQTLARRFGWWAWLSLTLGAIRGGGRAGRRDDAHQ